MSSLHRPLRIALLHSLAVGINLRWGKGTRHPGDRWFLEGPASRLRELARLIRIGREFIRTFEDGARKINADGPIDHHVQGTL